MLKDAYRLVWIEPGNIHACLHALSFIYISCVKMRNVISCLEMNDNRDVFLILRYKTPVGPKAIAKKVGPR